VIQHMPHLVVAVVVALVQLDFQVVVLVML
jgi:hypothetical protein